MENGGSSMSIQYKFPAGFWWGSATSATQIEGAANEGGKVKIFGIIGIKQSQIVFSIM